MNEIWKVITDYPNYEISNMGKIRNKDGLIMKQRLNTDGYYICNLSHQGKKNTFNVHRLVAKIFMDNFDENLTVDHIDNDKTNNNINNLRMMSRENNVLRRFGEHRKVKQLTKDYQEIAVYNSLMDAAKANATTQNIQTYSNSIGKVCRGINKSAYGYIWEYIEG